LKRSNLIATFFVLMAPLVLGCGGGGDGQPAEASASQTGQPVMVDPVSDTLDTPAEPSETPPETQSDEIKSQEELEAALKAKNPRFAGPVGVGYDEQGVFCVEINDPGVEDISPLARLPLKGMPRVNIFLEQTGVKDISVLEGLPLWSLYLTNTPVSDLSPLRGLKTKMKELNAIGSKVTDLSPLEGLDVEMIWLSECPISDISPLQNVRVVSLTLADTKVSDLSSLKGHPTLERLHIARTAVTDLSPLQWMDLTRLVFTPNRIKTGIEHARAMTSLTEIGIDFDQRLPPAQFWPQYDAGQFK